jgi:hypothetical protein
MLLAPALLQASGVGQQHFAMSFIYKSQTEGWKKKIGQ